MCRDAGLPRAVPRTQEQVDYLVNVLTNALPMSASFQGTATLLGALSITLKSEYSLIPVLKGVL